MLCPRALHSLLDQANTDSVDSTLLIDRDGSVLAHSGATTNHEAILTAAVSSNIWGSYELAASSANLSKTTSPTTSAGKKAIAEESEMMVDNTTLRYIILNCADGLAGVAVVPKTHFIVCQFSGPNCELGLIKKKLLALVDHLEEHLARLAKN